MFTQRKGNKRNKIETEIPSREFRLKHSDLKGTENPINTKKKGIFPFPNGNPKKIIQNG